MVKATKRPDHYKFTAGKRPVTLVAEERPDRDYEVYFRWQEPDPATGASKPRYVATGLSVRDDRGRRRRHKEKEVEEAVEKAQAFYAAGGDPRKWNAATSPTGVPRTLAEGFAFALPSKADPAHVGAMYPTRDRPRSMRGMPRTTSRRTSGPTPAGTSSGRTPLSSFGVPAPARTRPAPVRATARWSEPFRC